MIFPSKYLIGQDSPEVFLGHKFINREQLDKLVEHISLVFNPPPPTNATNSSASVSVFSLGKTFNGNASQPPARETRFLRNDLDQSLNPEQASVWQAHYPLGNLLPADGKGMTVDELRWRAEWYCKQTGLKYVGGVEDAIAELAMAGLVKAAKSE